MQLTFTRNGLTFSLSPELIVVACDPRGLSSVMGQTSAERAIFKALQNFTFFTTTLKVRPIRGQDRKVILDPQICSEMAGIVHGFRNETAKQWGLDVANAQAINIVTVGQIVAAGPPPPRTGLEAKRKLFLDSPPSWWPFQPGRYEIVQVEENQVGGTPHLATNPLDTPYFDHFDVSGLKSGLPWNWLDLQGANGTLYVHGSTCFESVLHCWSYWHILMQQPRVQAALPSRKDALIVILGAGPSGLLAAIQLRALGYTSVKLLEQSNRYAGKTHSLQVPDEKGTTICELGTCYMSPAYDDMIDSFRKFRVGTTDYDFTQGNERVVMGAAGDRGIVYPTKDGPKVMSFSDYGMMRACQWLGVPFDEGGRIIAEGALAVAAEQYVRIRGEIFDCLDCVMPVTMPAHDPYGVFTRSFAAFLDAHYMGVLKGYLEYAYEIQGYGPLNKIPAYYGLVWVTPDMAWPWGPTAGVTAWSLGWENIWEQMVGKLSLDLILEAQVTRIIRDGVVEDGPAITAR